MKTLEGSQFPERVIQLSKKEKILTVPNAITMSQFPERVIQLSKFFKAMAEVIRSGVSIP